MSTNDSFVRVNTASSFVYMDTTGSFVYVGTSKTFGTVTKPLRVNVLSLFFVCLFVFDLI